MTERSEHADPGGRLRDRQRVPARVVRPPRRATRRFRRDHGGPRPQPGGRGSRGRRRHPQMAEAVEPGLVASSGPRYFGFVVGGALPASIGADWLAAAWDQNAVLHAASPAAAAVEQVAGEWVLDLLGLPADSGFGLPGGPVSPTWSPSPRPAMPCSPGRAGMSRLAVSTGPRRSRCSSVLKHMPRWSRPSSTSASGVSGSCGCRPTSRVGCAPTPSLAHRRAWKGPTIVCSQAGNVNSGAFDPIAQIAEHLERQAQHVAPRGRSVRALGRGLAALPAPRRRRRAGRFVGHRRSQVVERGLRLRLRRVPGSRGAARGDVHASRLPHP